MVTRIRKSSRAHLYITEWREHRGLSVEQLAGRLETHRETVWRWENEQHRLNPDKIAGIAEALDIEPAELYRPPHRPSIDAMLSGSSDDLFQTAADIVRRLAKRA